MNTAEEIDEPWEEGAEEEEVQDTSLDRAQEDESFPTPPPEQVPDA